MKKMLSFRGRRAAAGALAAAMLVLSIGATTQPATRESAAEYGEEKYRLVSQPDEIVSVLRNGLTVIVKRVPSPVVSVRAYVRTGGIYEGRWLGGGLSHLLEHLVAGGSTQRRTEAENRTLLQQIGNNSNAYTTLDHTAYFIDTTPEHLDSAVDLLSGWMFGALITPDEYGREYEVVQRELEKGKGEPRRQFWYLSQLNRYRVSPARVPVIGYQEVIQGLSRDDVYEYYKLTYQPNNMVFSIAGDVEPQVMLDAVRKYVNDIPAGREPSRDLPAEPAVLAPRTVVATFPKLGQARFELAFPSIPLHHPDLYALDLLAAALSWGESSLLVEQIRDRQQLVSSIWASSFTPEYVDGSFEIGMELEAQKIDAATQAVFDLLETVKRDGIDEQRLARAKTQVRTARVKSEQTSSAIAASLATDFLSSGDPHFSQRYVERIAQVTAEQVREVANRYLDRQKLLTTVMLPAEYVGAAGLPAAEELIRPVVPTTQPQPRDQASPVVRSELGNGTVLLLKRITTTPLVAVQMYTLGGVTVENEQTNGLGNLAMQLLPRGTTTRSAQQIAEFFDSIGGEMNTGCGNNSWFYSALLLKEDLAKGLEVFADVVNNPSFPEDEIEQMKRRIIASIESQDADWHAQAMRFFKQAYFGPQSSPYQFMPIGTKPNVESFTRQQIVQWYEQKILPSRRVLAMFGDLDLEQARKLAAEHLGGGAKRRDGAVPPVGPFAAATPIDTHPAIDVTRVELNQTQQPLAGIVIGFESDSVIGDPANYPITVADTMASGFGYPTGYLHETLRGRGLVYVVHAQNWPGRSQKIPGTFLVYAGCDPRKVNEVIDLILQNIARLQGSGSDMQEDWFERSKHLIVTADAMDNETAAEQATTAALDELYGLGYDYHEQFARKIGAVTLAGVRSVASGRLRKCVVTISTPAPQLVELKSGVRRYESFPPVDLTPRGVQHDAPNSGP